MLLITVPAEVQAALILELAKAKNKECGGILLGEHVGSNHFAVRSLTVQRTGTFAAFIRSLRDVVPGIKAFCAARSNDYARFNYLGEWHSHPRFSTQPSSQDHASMREIATDIAVSANFVLLLVFRLNGNGLEGSAHTYLPDGSVHASQLEFEGNK